MADKDIAARHLAHFVDVFADIVNGVIFLLSGKWPSRLVRPEDLVDAQTRSVAGTGDRIREQERDVAKVWTVGKTVICLVGLEHQTQVDPDMAFRVFSYEGADYRRQLAERDAEARAKGKSEGGRKRAKRRPYPVVTFVLYFGTKRRWPKNKRALLDLFEDVDEALVPFLNNCRIHVIELAWLTAEQAAVFKSDFWIVVDYLRQTCQNKEFVPSDQVIVHVEAVARLLSALTGDRGLLENLPNIQKRGVPMTVRNFFGEAREQGKAEGGLNMLVSLVHDGLLRLGDAAKKAGMSEDEFKIRMRERERAGEA